GPNLAAFMAVDSTDGPDYGKLRILRMPSNTTIPGPGQVQNNFTNKFSGELNVLGLGQAQIRYGNLLTLPFADGLIYIEPVYVQTAASSGQEPYPILRRVLVSYGNKVSSKDTLEAALQEVFGESTDQQAPAEERTETDTESQTETESRTSALNSAISDAEKAYADAQAALSANPPDWAKYGEAQQRLKAALDRIKAARPSEADAEQPAESPSPTPTSSPTTSAPATPEP